MLKFLAALALAATLAAPAALADGSTPRATPEKRPAPILKRSPTDETRTMPRTRQSEMRISNLRVAPRARGVARSGTEPLAYSYLPAHPSLLAPAAGPARAAITTETRYLYYAPASPDFDGAPCPTLSRESLGELFACTWR